jgi:hypothetical protein
MTKPKPLYGWWSDQHFQKHPEQVCVYLTPDGEKLRVTQVLPSDSNPDTYCWPDARCLSPVTKVVKSCQIEAAYLRSSPPTPVSEVKGPPHPNWLEQALVKFRKLTGNSQ